jgi:vacuolar-type H+-ATPase subunit I/STV1
MTKETCQQSNPSVLSKIRRIFLLGLIVLIVISLMFLPTLLKGIRHRLEIPQRIELLMKQSLELSEQIDTQQTAVIEENMAIAEELKKPQEQRATNLDKRLNVNAQRTEAIRELIKQQQETLDILRKTEEELGIVPKKENPEAKAVLEKY